MVCPRRKKVENSLAAAETEGTYQRCGETRDRQWASRVGEYDVGGAEAPAGGARAEVEASGKNSPGQGIIQTGGGVNGGHEIVIK